MDTVVIGRSSDADYSIAHDAISRRHCRLLFDDGAVWIEDLQSSNGTVLDGQQLEPGERSRVPPDTEIVLADEIVLDGAFLGDLRAQLEATRSSRTPSSTRPSWLSLPNLDLPPLKLPTDGTAARVAAGALVLLLMVGWAGYSYHTQSSRIAETQATVEQLREINESLFGSPGQETSYQDLLTYRTEADSLLSTVNTRASALESGILGPLLLGSRTDNVRQTARTLRSRTQENLKKANRLVESIEGDHKSFVSTKKSAESALSSVQSQIDAENGINTLQDAYSNIKSERSSVDATVESLDSKLEKSVFEGDAETVRTSVYEHMKGELGSTIEQLGATEKSLSTAIDYQKAHRKALSAVSSKLLARSDGISAVYQNLEPLAEDVAERVRPVRQSISTLEKPILSTGPLGDDVTALSLIKDIDPVTGKTIVVMRDLSDAVLEIEDEISTLANRIGSLREAASSFRTTPSRSEAIQLRGTATQTRKYVREQRDLFNPIEQKVDKGRDYIDTFDRVVAEVPSDAARRMLGEFSNASRSLLALLERPVRLWKNEIDTTTERLKRIRKWEKRYQKIIENITAPEHSKVRFGADAE